MRSRRLSFLAGWLAVALLAALGFAAFAPSDGPAEQVEAEAAAAGMGHTAGAFAGLSFALLAAPVDDITVSDYSPPESLANNQAPNAEPPEDADDSNGTIASESTGWLSEVEVRALVSKYFEPADVNKAVRVAWCESRFDPKSINLRTGAQGIFQHLPRYWEERSSAAGFEGAEPTSAEASIAAAAWVVYNGGGWDVFGCRG